MPEDIILHLCTRNDNHGVWFLIYQARQTGFFVILCYFLPFFPSNNSENQSFEKIKKASGDIIYASVPQMTIIRYMVPEISTATDRFFLSSLAMFCPFTPPKNENITKMKEHLDISSFYTSAPKIMIIGYTVPEMWRMTDVIVIFHFGLYFALLPP